MNKRLSATQIIMLGFLAAIIAGTVLLALPVSSASGKAVALEDALFTATTSVCVTGLVTLTTASAWSVFGQAVILVLIQIGGLGIITVTAGVVMAANRKMRLPDRLLLQEAFNLNSLAGQRQFVKKVIAGTFAVEGAGALIYMTAFVPAMGARGIWASVFNSVSAFCNAGLDVIGEDSLCDFVVNPVVNFVTCALIILGGIGFIVWLDVLRVFREKRENRQNPLKRLSLHSKIALSATAVLLVAGTALFLIFEYDNPYTIGAFSFTHKLEAAFFQSVTTRTAGFATVPQNGLTPASAVTALLFMFIGGSPVGTAGGVKTVTIAVILAAALSSVRSKNETTMFRRSIAPAAVKRALAVVAMSFAITFVSSVALLATSSFDTLDAIYEAVSATATVGLSRGVTGSFGTVQKLIITATMYLGRVGPISLAVAFNLRRENKNAVKDPTEEISVG
ncbi:MAG: potassium transporter KtrB [Clostridia bacterium]|nr:potassium transporter KtrB [Clostridia bacterium]